ncbi:MAG: mechanosensitive ion channel family protein [Verrucomicrobia bacterium]|nr:mechanosensitive ion channel family protein [Verrucomicrobiota bacterium]
MSAELSTATNTVQSAASQAGPDAARKSGWIFSEDGELTFGLERISWLQHPLAGTSLWRYVASVLYVLLALAAAKLLDLLAHAYLVKWGNRSKASLNEVVVALLDGPIKVICFVVLLHIGLRVLNWPQWIEDLISKGLQIVVAVSLTYMATKFVDVLLVYWRKRTAADADKTFDEHLFPIIGKTLKAFVVVVAALVTAQNLGVNITSLLASLSIGGLAVGLAAQDTLANVFGAVSVLIDKPFRVGDRIKLEDVDGTVETIGLRSTRIRSLDGHLITVPNKTIGGAVITNVTRRPTIKTEMNLGVTYDTSTDKLKRSVEIIREVYRSHPMTSDLIVSFNKFADSSLNILVVHWWNGTDYKAYLEGMQELNFQVKTRFDAERIEFAFPTQTVYLKQEA